MGTHLPPGETVVSSGPEHDQLALRELAYRYARAADRRDYETFRTVFTEDGRVAGFSGVPGESELLYEMVGHDAICDGMRGLERYDTTFHFVGNQLVEVDGDTASGETYCVAHHLYDHAGVRMNYTMFIRYQDRYRRTGAGWRIRERLLALDFGRHAPIAENPPG
jgi:3-phenylpropionate/cinnamic acid dioxygenase small subunit